MGDNPLFPCRWDEMPDPRAKDAPIGISTMVELHEADWRKVAGKHFANSKEPWGDTIREEALKVLTASPSERRAGGETDEATHLGLEVLRGQMFLCLKRPLVILYSCLRQGTPKPGHRWLLVLPCGAVAVVWAETSTNRLKTCYFTGAVAVVMLVGERWRHSLRQQVQEYAAFDKSSGAFVYPRPEDRREVDISGGTTELRYNIRFAAGEAWGFVPGTPGTAWKRPSWNWPA